MSVPAAGSLGGAAIGAGFAKRRGLGLGRVLGRVTFLVRRGRRTCGPTTATFRTVLLRLDALAFEVLVGRGFDTVWRDGAVFLPRAKRRAARRTRGLTARAALRVLGLAGERFTFFLIIRACPGLSSVRRLWATPVGKQRK